MIVNNNIRLIFTGDYTDRGPESLKVVATAMLLAIKNPGKVILIRGNHEDVYVNVHHYKLLDEIKNITQDATETKLIMRELANAYEFMPVGVFAGHQGFNQTSYQFFVHGCIDIRINYSKFLDDHAEEYANNGGICFWHLTLNDLMSKQEAKDFLQDVLKNSESTVEKFSVHFNYPCPASGFLWNDIEILKFEISKSDRNQTEDYLITLHPTLLMKLCAKCETQKSKISGIICGHNHVLPKILDAMEKGNLDLSRPSSPCFMANPQFNNFHLLSPNAKIFTSDNFSVICFLSGSIDTEAGPVVYPSTFLMSHINKDGHWTFEPVFSFT